MRFLSPLLKGVVYPSLARVGHFRRRRLRQISVVTYHGVYPRGYEANDDVLDGALVTGENFIHQLRLLKSSYQVVTPPQFQEALLDGRELPERAVLITCDDGLLNHATEMVPILQAEKLTCLFFVTGASISDSYSLLWYVELYLMLMRAETPHLRMSIEGSEIEMPLTNLPERRKAWLVLLRAMSRLDAAQRKDLLATSSLGLGLRSDWKNPYTQDPTLRSRFCVMGIPELQHLVECGMSIGAHSLTHPVPSAQPEELWSREMNGSRDLLQRTLGQPVWSFAYPFGDDASVSQREYTMAKAAGFQCAFRNAGGPVRSPVSHVALPRIHVSSAMKLGEFEAHVSGFHDALRQRLGRA